eukprot:1629750-Prymnesium_polylepis.1
MWHDLHARGADDLVDNLLVLNLVPLTLREQVLLAPRVVAHDRLERLRRLVLSRGRVTWGGVTWGGVAWGVTCADSSCTPYWGDCMPY